MHPADIICALSKAGYTQQRVAAKLRVTRTAVNLVIHNRSRSYNIASFISATTNIPLNKIWPDGRYSMPRKAA